MSKNFSFKSFILVLSTGFLLLNGGCRSKVNVSIEPSDEQKAQAELLVKILEQLATTNAALLESQNRSADHGEKLYNMLHGSFSSLQQELVALNTSSTLTNENLKLVIANIEALTKPNSPLILSLVDIGSKLNAMSAGLGGVGGLAGLGPQLANVITELQNIRRDIDATNAALGTLSGKVDATTLAVTTGATTLGGKLDANKGVLDTINTGVGNVGTKLDTLNTALGTINTTLGGLTAISTTLNDIKTSLAAGRSVHAALTLINNSIGATNLAIGDLNNALTTISGNTAATTNAVTAAHNAMMGELTSIKIALETGNVNTALNAINTALSAGGSIPTALEKIDATLTGEIKTALDELSVDISLMGRDANVNILFGEPLGKVYNEQMRNGINLLISSLDKNPNIKMVASYFRYKSEGKVTFGSSKETDWTITVETKEAGTAKYYTVNSTNPTTITNNGIIFPVTFNNQINNSTWQQVSYGTPSKNTIPISVAPKWGKI